MYTQPKQPTLAELRAIGEQCSDRLLSLIFDVPQGSLEDIAAARAESERIDADIQRLTLNPNAVLVGRYEV